MDENSIDSLIKKEITIDLNDNDLSIEDSLLIYMNPLIKYNEMVKRQGPITFKFLGIKDESDGEITTDPMNDFKMNIYKEKVNLKLNQTVDNK
jgi:hypothetical protein